MPSRPNRVSPADCSAHGGGSKWIVDNSLKGPWSFKTKEKLLCLCEGGGMCSREDPTKQRGGNAIPGLHCNWVGEWVLAMARPWQSNVTGGGLLVDAFVKSNIGMILNLQEVGEHDNCGPGNLPKSGFTYDPDSFMAAQIGFYNFSWRDMGVPDLSKMMDIVQVMHHVVTVEKRKIAVHCHAGLGRTGLAIACYFVFSGMYDAPSAVAAVRKHRPGALQTSKQVLFVSVFEKYLAYLRCTFPVTGSTPMASPRGGAEPTAESAASTSSSTGASQASTTRRGGRAPPQQPVTQPVEVSHQRGAQVEAYASGLTIFRQAKDQASLLPQPPAGPVMRQSSSVLLDDSLPWDPATLQIIPDKFDPGWQPVPPNTYSESLRRQRNLVHGQPRRAYLHLHRFVKEAVFAVIRAAASHQQGGKQGSLAGALSELLGQIQEGAPSPSLSDKHAALKQLCQGAGGAADLQSALSKVRSSANFQAYQPLQSAPLAVVLLALDGFFSSFDPGVPCLSHQALLHITKVHTKLPFARPPNVPENVQVASAAYLMSPLSASDQELLLLMAAMMRFVARASGPGCEEDLVAIGRWVVRLMLGRSRAVAPRLEEAVLSYFWWLLLNDAAFAASILTRKQRLEIRTEANSSASSVTAAHTPPPPLLASAKAAPAPHPSQGHQAPAGGGAGSVPAPAPVAAQAAPAAAPKAPEVPSTRYLAPRGSTEDPADLLLLKHPSKLDPLPDETGSGLSTPARSSSRAGKRAKLPAMRPSLQQVVPVA